MHVPQRYAYRALGGGESEFCLGEVDQLAEGIREKRAIRREADNSAYDHAVSHILPTEHLRPPSGGILGSASTAAVAAGVAWEGKDP